MERGLHREGGWETSEVLDEAQLGFTVQEGENDAMPTMPDMLIDAWEHRRGPAVFGTVNAEGQPNVIYVNCVWRLNEWQFVIADNYFHKTKANIEAGSEGALLFLSSTGGSYQVKGSIDYHTSGEVYETMKRWNDEMDPSRPGVGAAVVNVEEVYRGAERVL